MAQWKQRLSFQIMKCLKRDMTNESVFNIILRIIRAGTIRLRGCTYSTMGMFFRGSSLRLTIGKSPKFMNTKWMLFRAGVGFGDFCRIECYSYKQDNKTNFPKLTIGKKSSFGDHVHIGAANSIIIGNDVLCGSKVLIIDHDHGKGGEMLQGYAQIPPRDRPLESKGPILIGNNVWIGESVIILGGSEIGDGAIVAANSTVRGVVPPYTVHISR